MPITTTEAADAIPEVLMVDVLDYLRDRLVLARMVRRDMRDAVSAKGDKIGVPKLGDLSVQEPAEGDPLTFASPSNSKVIVDLDKDPSVTWSVTSKARAVAIDEALDYGKQAIGRLGGHIEAALAGLYTEATTEVGTGGTAVTTSTLLDAWEALEAANVPDDMRFAAVAVKDAKNLLDTDKLTKVNESGDQGAALRRAQLGALYGMDIFSSNKIVSTAGPVFHGMAGHRDGITLAIRPLELPDAGVVASVITDEESGLSFRLMRSYDIDTKSTKFVLDLLYGVKMVDPRLMVEILS